MRKALPAPFKQSGHLAALPQEGMRGFYQGWLANTLKVAPQSSIRFVAYEALKGLLAVQRARTDT